MWQNCKTNKKDFTYAYGVRQLTRRCNGIKKRNVEKRNLRKIYIIKMCVDAPFGAR